jgi:hypothetical protein
VSFEQALKAISGDHLLDVIEHPNQERYLSQRIFVVKMNQYVYLVPFVETDQEIFLKTIIPSRKLKNLKQLASLEVDLMRFVQQYGIQSEAFYQRFQFGELANSQDFVQWHAIYSTWLQRKVRKVLI